MFEKDVDWKRRKVNDWETNMLIMNREKLLSRKVYVYVGWRSIVLKLKYCMLMNKWMWLRYECDMVVILKVYKCS